MKLNKIIFVLTIGLIGTLNQSCDKVENPTKPPVLLDTTIYPGNWADYPEAVWTANTNSLRNVLLEDYTGHTCPNCPAAAVIAKDIEAANTGRVFTSAVHASPGGLSSFQWTAVNCGQASNPNDKYCTELFCDESTSYGATFATGYGFFANPMGTFNRTTPTGPTSMFGLMSTWGSRVSDIITTNDLKVNIQAQSNYYPSTNGFYLHTETEILEDLSGNYSTVVYLLEDEIIDWQDVSGFADSLYEHHNVLRGCIDGLAWGRPITGGSLAGDKTYLDYSYKLPSGKDNTDYHLLIYVYDLATYEILQVIKQDL